MRLDEESIMKILNDFAEAWNRGDLEMACEVYGDDASFIGKSGYVRGKDKVLDRYRVTYPDPSAMGFLTFELVEFRLARDPMCTMATAILRWHVRKKDGQEQSGLAMETYERRGDQIFIVQDATI